MKHIGMIAVFGLTANLAWAEPSVERGEYLVRGPAGCGNCHTPIGPDGFVMDQELGGRLVEKNEMFTAIAPNITPGGRVADLDRCRAWPRDPRRPAPRRLSDRPADALCDVSWAFG